MKLVILGGGSAGVMFANRMRKAFSEKEVEITVIEKSEKHIYQPAFTLIVFDLEKPENIIKPSKDLFFDGINVIIDEATKIHPQNNKVTTAKHGDISYDYLVVATGAKLDMSEPEGMQAALEKGENVMTFYTLDGSLKVKDALKKMESGTIVSTFVSLPIKCPAAPIKLILMAEDMMRRAGKRDKFRFILSTPMPYAFSRPPYMYALNNIFKSRGIETEVNFPPSELDDEKRVIGTFDGREIKYDLLVITPGHLGEAVVENSEGVGDAAGFVTCDKNKMVQRNFSNIFGIGDATDFPTSKTASGARKQAKILVEIFKDILAGKEPTATYDGEIICPILVRDKRAIFAQFNYTESISPAIESYINWVLKVYMLRPLYWNMMLKGLL